jgi:biotin carboxyl carrier protein
MKMEHRIEAPGAGTVAGVLVREGDIVASGAPLIVLA